MSGLILTEDRSRFFDYLEQMLWRAYYCARKGKRTTEDEHKFEINAAENIHQLAIDIMTRNYRPTVGIAFITKEPVIREIFAAPFRDRVVHHVLFNACSGWWDRRLIYDSYSCRVNKGTHFGIRRLHHHMQACSENFTVPCTIVKLDIQGFFMSLDREKLLKRILWGLDQQFKENYNELYHVLKFLWTSVIMDDPVQGVRLRGKRSDWDQLPTNKSLFNQPEGIGIVIGNLTSQLASNIFLDPLDRYIISDLGLKHYGRYVDDFYFIVPDSEKEYALACIDTISEFLSKLGLTLHPKKHYIQPISHGVPFLGAVVYPHCTVPGKRIKKEFIRAAYEFASGYESIESLISYMGMLSNFQSAKFEKEVFESLGWDYYSKL